MIRRLKLSLKLYGRCGAGVYFHKKHCSQGKSVCTSNKELVARHGAELLEIARERNINYLFEAGCGGGIPIIRPLNSSLTIDEIDEDHRYSERNYQLHSYRDGRERF